MHRIVIEASEDGWLLRRPGWSPEWLARRELAERAGESVAYEFHQRSGRPACVVLAAEQERVIARFG